MPEYLREMIENDTFKDQPKEFIDRTLAAYKALALGEASPQVKEAIATGRREQQKNFEIAKAANLLCERVKEYVPRGWTMSGEESGRERKRS
jgi:hypothetical protein